MIQAIKRYTRWLHTRWPAGTVEKLPLVNEDGSTNVTGLYVVGDLTGIPLLKFSSDTGAKAVRQIAEDAGFKKRDTTERDGKKVYDIAIVGGGVSGVAAAMEAEKQGLSYVLIEASELFSTIVNFPKAKPIYTYPTDMTPAGELQFGERSEVKEGLLEEMMEKVEQAGIKPLGRRVEAVKRSGGLLHVHLAEGKDDNESDGRAPQDNILLAHRAIVGIGRSGNFRKLGIPGEDKDKVYNRLHDPKDFCGKDVVVVGGGDSAMETAIALATCGCHVTLSYRKPEFSRPKPENIEKLVALSEDSLADVMVEQPSSERVTTSAGGYTGKSGKDHEPGSVKLMMASQPKAIADKHVVITDSEGNDQTIENDVVFSMIGREPPLDFFRRSGVHIRGEWRGATWATFIAFLGFCTFLYLWKGGAALGRKQLNPEDWAAGFGSIIGEASRDPSTFLGTLRVSIASPSFYYTLAYSLCILIFGIKRIRRRKTPYVTRQTIALTTIQWFPLFLMPYLIFPFLAHSGVFESGYRTGYLSSQQIESWKTAVPNKGKPADSYTTAQIGLTAPQDVLADDRLTWEDFAYDSNGLIQRLDDQVLIHTGSVDNPTRRTTINLSTGHVLARDEALIAKSPWWVTQLFPEASYEHGREYWRSAGFILAWPLFIHNVFSNEPMTLWLIISLVQTFVIIPLIVFRWGKGAYCGWICSCGALAETMGDAHRHKMPHGPFWNRFNMLGQYILWFALGLFVIRVLGWVMGPDSAISKAFVIGNLGYKGFVDLLLAGILGVGLYFHFSGRTWCRFACPLAALMHIYARFSQFRILADKKKCISCNVCTSVCHQGIDIMNFANKGLPMEDPQCVRCSACVQGCPTGVLTFGRVDPKTGKELGRDKLPASPVQMAELTVNGKPAAM